MKYIVLVALLFVLVPIAGAQVDTIPETAAQVYTITDLGPMEPVAINSWGQVAGNLNDHAVVWTKSRRLGDLGLLPGGTFSRAVGINDLGAVAGTADGPGVVTYAARGLTAECNDLAQPFIWTPGKGFAVPPSVPVTYDGEFFGGSPCAQVDFATGFNIHGQVVGGTNAIASYAFGFSWDSSHGMTLVGGGYQDSFRAINNFGLIAGQTGPGGPLIAASHAALWKNGVMTDLGYLGSEGRLTCSGTEGVNDWGQAVGWSGIASSGCYDLVNRGVPVHAFLWDADTGMQNLGTLPGDTDSVALRMNLMGQVIGNSGNIVLLDFQYHVMRIEVTGRPFVWSESDGMQDLNEMINPHSGWNLESAADINVWGQIVGIGTHKGQARGFLLTPKFPLRCMGRRCR